MVKLFKCLHEGLPNSRPNPALTGTVGGHAGGQFVRARTAADAVAAYLKRWGLHESEASKTVVAEATVQPLAGDEVLNADSA